MAGNAGELYLEIKVDDDGSIKVKQFGNELKKAGKDGEQAFDKLDRESRQLHGSMESLRGTVGQLAAAFSVYKLAQFTKDTALASGRYQTLAVVLETVGRNYNYTAEELNAYTEQLQAGGIAMIESRGVLLSMIQAEMDLTKARELSRTAQNAAVIGNINSSEAFERMVHGIKAAEIEVLRTIGINVNFEQSYKKAAKAMGKTTTALTEQEKVQIRTNAVLEAGKGIAGAYESAMSTASKKVSSFTRFVEDFRVKMGDAFQPATIAVVDQATEAMKRLTTEVATQENQKRLAELAETAVTTAENLAEAGSAALSLTGKIADGWNALPEPIREYGLLALIGGKMFGAQAAAAIAIIGTYTEAEKAMAEAVRIKTNDGLDWTERFSLWIADLEHGTDVLDQLDRQMKQLADNAHVFRGTVVPPPADPRDRDYHPGHFIAPSAPAPKVVPDPEETEEDADKVKKAITSISIKLAAMNDVGTDGQARMARLTKEYNDFVKVLGTGHEKIGEFAEAMTYVDEHHGHTPAEVASSTRAIEDNIVALEKEIEAVEKATNQFGQVNQARLSMFRAQAEAEQDYREAVLEGVDPVVAARQRDLSLQLAQANTTRKNLQVLTEFSREYQQLVLGETEFKIAQIEEQARVWREAGADSVQVAQWEAQAKLQASREWHDGAIRAFQDYADSTSDMARGMASMITNDLDSIRDTLVDLADTGKFKWQDMVDSMRHELNKLVIDKAIMAPISSGMGSFVSSFFPNAHGGAYASPSLSRYSGQVVDRPSFFAFAHGAGVMGENRGKAEVIAPLFRDPVSNDMGVKAKVEVGESAPVYVTVDTKLELINQTGQAMSASTEPTSNGLRMILRAVGQSAATGGEVAKGIQAGFKVQKRVR